MSVVADAADSHCGEAPIESAGSVLAKARNAQGISLDTIHEKTLIPVWKLKALESDQYEQLGGRPFVIGYLRQVAKLLKVDDAPLVASVRAYSPASSALRTEEEIEEAAELRRNTPDTFAERVGALWSLRALVVVILLWSIAVWWFKEDADQSQQSDGSLQTPIELERPKDPQDETRKMLDSATMASPPPSTTLPKGIRPGLSDQAITLPVTLVEPNSDRPNDEPSPAETEAVPDASPAPVATSTDQLEMHFSDQCWVEVEDANGDILVAKLYDKGDNLRLAGDGPFSVKLGNASAAKVSINGRPISVVPHGARSTLRLNVSP